jgi:putative transposase
VRRQQTGNLHFVTFSCDRRNPYLASAEAKRVFQSALECTRKRYQFDIIGYVIMPEHVHLLLTEPPVKPLSRRACGRYAVHFSEASGEAFPVTALLRLQCL